MFNDLEITLHRLKIAEAISGKIQLSRFEDLFYGNTSWPRASDGEKAANKWLSGTTHNKGFLVKTDLQLLLVGKCSTLSRLQQPCSSLTVYDIAWAGGLCVTWKWVYDYMGGHTPFNHVSGVDVVKFVHKRALCKFSC